MSGKDVQNKIGINFPFFQDSYNEEMYNLDNDSFLNSLEAMTIPSGHWPEFKHTNSDV